MTTDQQPAGTPPAEEPAGQEADLTLTAEEQRSLDAALARLEAEDAPAGAEEPASAGEEDGGAEDRPADPLAKVRREAAGYRVKLREAEGERDGLRETVERMQR